MEETEQNNVLKQASSVNGGRASSKRSTYATVVLRLPATASSVTHVILSNVVRSLLTAGRKVEAVVPPKATSLCWLHVFRREKELAPQAATPRL